MSDTYDLYAGLHAIANAIVRKSKGLGFHHFDAEQVKADVDAAAGVAAVADEYWSVMHAHNEAVEKVRAAKVLGLDMPELKNQADVLANRRDLLVKQMQNIRFGWHKTYHGDWVKNED